MDLTISKARQQLSNKILELEKQGLFDVDANEDPETIPLKPGQVDYKYSKFKTRFNAKIANFIAHN